MLTVYSNNLIREEFPIIYLKFLNILKIELLFAIVTSYVCMFIIHIYSKSIVTITYDTSKINWLFQSTHTHLVACVTAKYIEVCV